jgi:hypothetical protein
MKTIKVSEATNIQLDWLVAKCEGYVWVPIKRPSRCFDCHHYEEQQGRDDAIQYCHHPNMNFLDGGEGDNWSSNYECHKKCPYKEEVQKPVYPPYSTDWAQGGPIIGRAYIVWDRNVNNDIVAVCWRNGERFSSTDVDVYPSKPAEPLIAAMRCYVTSKLGETAEVPEELP